MLKSEIYFPIIVLVHLALWGIDLSLYQGDVALYPGESPTQRVLGEVFSSWVMTVLGINLLMATRARWVERIFGGLDKMYVIHRRAGVIAVVLLLLHFGVVPRGPEFTPGKPLGFAAMVLIFLGVMLAAAPLFKRRIPYQKWLGSHRLMGLFFTVGFVHALLVPTLISQLPLVRTYVFGVAAVGVLSWLYKAFFQRLLNRPLPYEVATVKRWGKAVVEITLRPKGKALPHRAGQFAFFTFTDLDKRESHPFTIASAPEDEMLRVVVKASGDFTADFVEQVSDGQAVLVEGSYGHFTQEYIRFAAQVWVAGGIGITPFLSMARDLKDRDVTLYWSVRTDEEAFFDEELQELAAGNPRLTYTIWKSNERGYIGAEDIPEATQSNGVDVAVCGPVALRDALYKGLRSKGVPAGRNHYEEFSFR